MGGRACVRACVCVVRTDEAVFIIEISWLSASVLAVYASGDVLAQRGCDLDATNVHIRVWCYFFHIHAQKQCTSVCAVTYGTQK